MHTESRTKLLVLVTLFVSFLQGTSAASTHRRYRRQVPQEWAHAKEVNIVDKMLKLSNPLDITHPIFSLLGNEAASNGTGKLDKKHLDCFQKIVADQAFTNAKKAGNKEGQEAAIIFASVEKNTKTVGVASVPCKSKKMVNPEIERLIQHQDAASPGAAENNKKSALLAALSLKEIGSDPSISLRTGTFKAGDTKNTNNGRGNSCDDEKDTEGCIFTKKALVEDVTKAEIDEFVQKHAGGSGEEKKDVTQFNKKPNGAGGKDGDVMKKDSAAEKLGGTTTIVVKEDKEKTAALKETASLASTAGTGGQD
ncbi:hypothetical protein PtB15_2B96 [Puccinia triticina]|nr:hypothetical protein PtB15_2B96 [Puccinia triticina]